MYPIFPSRQMCPKQSISIKNGTSHNVNPDNLIEVGKKITAVYYIDKLISRRFKTLKTIQNKPKCSTNRKTNLKICLKNNCFQAVAEETQSFQDTVFHILNAIREKYVLCVAFSCISESYGKDKTVSLDNLNYV